ncbi:glutamate receptor ionotropic, kainate glr-3-like [Tubulanus polymorphus]|uniref:glutamate receptor ionotropic, kainate glr-3-like n=1 Tax=Tubulanus polymorphus TaxID=672921 RepID=UPI003DA2B662
MVDVGNPEQSEEKYAVMEMLRNSAIWILLFSSGFLVTATSAKTMRVACIITDDFVRMQERVEYFSSAIARVQSRTNAPKPSINFTFVDIRSEIRRGVGLNEKLKTVLQAKYDAAIGPPVDYFQRYIGTEYFIVGAGVQAKPCPPNNKDKVHNVLPTLDQVMSLVFSFIKTSEDKHCYSFMIITHNTGELDDFLRSFECYSKRFKEKPCFRHYPFVMSWTNSSKNQNGLTRRQLETSRALGISHIIVFSRMPNAYFPFEIATYFGMNTYLYRWLYLTYEDVPYDFLAQYEITQTNPSLSFLDMFNESLVKTYNLNKLLTYDKTRDYGLFDTLLTLNKFAEQRIREKSDGFFDSEVEVDGLSGHFNFSLKNFRKTPVVYVCETNGERSKTDCVMTELKFVDWNQVHRSKPIIAVPNGCVRAFSADHADILVRLEPPFFMKPKDGKLTGLFYDLLEMYSTLLCVSFDYADYPISEDLFAVLQQVADAAAGGFAVDVEQKNVVDYTAPIYPASLHLLSRVPRVEKNRWQFLKPFVGSFWLVVLAMIFAISILLSLLTFIDYTTDTISFADTLYFTVARFSSGSSETNPNAIPSRILVAIVMYLSMALSAAYTANMTAFLRLRADEQPIRNLIELIERGEGNFGVIDHSEVKKILSKTRKFPEIMVWNIIRRTGNILPDLETAVERIVNENFILLTDTLTARYAVAQRCDLIEHGLKQLYGLRFAFALPVGAMVKRPIDALIVATRASGQQKDIEEKYMKRQFLCDRDIMWLDEISETEPLTFFEMSGVFFTLIIGLAVASFVALIEHLLLVYRRAKSQENTGGGGGDPSNQSPEPVPL